MPLLFMKKFVNFMVSQLKTTTKPTNFCSSRCFSIILGYLLLVSKNLFSLSQIVNQKEYSAEYSTRKLNLLLTIKGYAQFMDEWLL